jgi:hypothetical protein
MPNPRFCDDGAFHDSGRAMEQLRPDHAPTIAINTM